MAEISGKKYYDANLNGQWDPNETGISGWKIAYTGAASGTLTTGAGGTFSTFLMPGNYTLAEKVANSPWIQTGNTANQASASGGSLGDAQQQAVQPRARERRLSDRARTSATSAPGAGGGNDDRVLVERQWPEADRRAATWWRFRTST